MTSPGTARPRLPGCGSVSRVPPHSSNPRARARPRHPRSHTHSPPRIPPRPRPPSAAKPGPGVGEPRPPAPAPSPPTRTAPSSLLSRPLAFPAALALLAFKVLPNFLLRRAGAGSAAGCCAAPPGLGSLERHRRRVAAGGLAQLPQPAPGPLRRDSPALRSGSPPPGRLRPCADSRAAETSLPFRLLRLLPSASSFARPLESIPWGVGAPPPGRQPGDAGLRGHRGGHVSR